MVGMQLVDTSLRAGSELGFTADHLDTMPDDGNCYELLDGTILVSPAPSPRHQRVSMRLGSLLHAGCPDDLEVLAAPIDWRVDRFTSLQPDLLVVARHAVDIAGATITEPRLALVVEILSPTSRRRDQLLKRDRYSEAGVRAYWMVDPHEPSLVALEMIEGSYREVSRAVGRETCRLVHPFPVEITPAALVS